MTINKTIIKRLRSNYQGQLPEDLVRYLMVKYKEEPFPYEYNEQDLYNNIISDIRCYYAGELNVTIKSPYKRLEEDRDAWRSACITAEQENELLRERIRVLELTMSNLRIDPKRIRETENILDGLPFN